MSSKIDLTGQRFGRLLVLRESKYRPRINGNVNWLCKCDCGNFVDVRSGDLRKGHTQSCSCYQKDMVSKVGKLYGKLSAKDLTGQKFGRLLVLRESKYKPRNNECVNWLCRCDCGAFTIVPSHSLTSSNTKSCGCYRKSFGVLHGQSRTKEYRRAATAKRRELEKLFDSEWNHVLVNTLLDFQPICVICGMTDQEHQERYGRRLHIDHVLPLSKGYGLKPGNAIVLCQSHNDIKHTKNLDQLPIDWQIKIIRAAKQFEYYWKDIEYASSYDSNDNVGH